MEYGVTEERHCDESDDVDRHCERSEAISGSSVPRLPRIKDARSDGKGKGCRSDRPVIARSQTTWLSLRCSSSNPPRMW